MSERTSLPNISVGLLSFALLIAFGLPRYSPAQKSGTPAAGKLRSRIEQEIDRALKEAATQRKELHDELTSPKGVFGLLNQPARWQLRIRAARCALEKAKVLFAVSTQKLNPKLMRRYQELAEKVMSDEADRRFAEKLDRIRLRKATVIDGKFNLQAALRWYPRAFRQAGLALDKVKPKQAAENIRKSAIRQQLVAALDDWAFVAMVANQKGLTEKLLSIARMADPDVLRDRIRDPNLWRNRPAMKKLSHEILKDSRAFSQQSPQFLNLVGGLLNNREELPWRRKAVLFNPRDFWLTFGLGNALMPANPQEAAGYYRAALAIRPESSAAWNNLGKALTEQKKFDEALAACRKALALDPQNGAAWKNLGNALRGQMKSNDALQAYRKAIALDPNDGPAWNNLGNTFIAVGRFAEATEAFQKSLAIEPQNDRAWNDYGRLLIITRKLDEAKAAFKKSIALNPKSPEAWYNLGHVYKQTGQLQRATECFRRAIQIDPNFVPARKELGNT